MRVEGLLRCLERIREKSGTLAIVPGAVVASDRVVMRDRAAGGDHRVQTSALDGLPLLEQAAVMAGHREGEIGRGPVRVDKRQVTSPARPVACLMAASVAAFTRSCKLSKRSQVMAVSKVSLMTAQRIVRSRV